MSMGAPYTIKLSGVDDLVKILENANAQLKQRVLQAHIDAMQRVVEASRSVAESRGYALSDTIMLGTVDSENVAVSGGCFAPYAWFPELKYPYWRPFVWLESTRLRDELNMMITEFYK